MDVNEGSVNEGTVKKFKYPSGYQLVYPEDLGDRITKNKKTGEIIGVKEGEISIEQRRREVELEN